MTDEKRCLTLRVVVPDPTQRTRGAAGRGAVRRRLLRRSLRDHQRDGDYVLWGEWRNPDEDEVDLPASERLAEQLVAADPRQAAEVCRGSTDFARQPAPYQATFPLL
ncbi:hypothetical protein ACFTZF_38125 [Streptomyces mirabilis]|uniref:hypothetical protein n=1 Tax=Streptomyces mirabilis TaxID=68239 RepID=UPI0036293A00